MLERLAQIGASTAVEDLPHSFAMLRTLDTYAVLHQHCTLAGIEFPATLKAFVAAHGLAPSVLHQFSLTDMEWVKRRNARALFLASNGALVDAARILPINSRPSAPKFMTDSQGRQVPRAAVAAAIGLTARSLAERLARGTLTEGSVMLMYERGEKVEQHHNAGALRTKQNRYSRYTDQLTSSTGQQYTAEGLAARAGISVATVYLRLQDGETVDSILARYA